MPNYKECSDLYEGDPEDEVIAAMCLTGETYGSVQANREVDEYYMLLSQPRNGLAPSLVPQIVSHIM